MSEKEIQEYQDKLDMGLKLAEKRMLEEKALRGQSVVVMNKDGVICHIPASQVLAENELFFNSVDDTQFNHIPAIVEN